MDTLWAKLTGYQKLEQTENASVDLDSLFSLLLLPKYVLLTILVDWISLIDLVYLDSALCSSRHRPYFGQLFISVTFRGIRDVYCKKSCLKWLNSRCITVNSLSIVVDRNFRDNLTCCVRAATDCVIGPMCIFPGDQHYLAKLQSMQVLLKANISKHYIMQVVDHCHNLTELSVSCTKTRPISLDILAAIIAQNKQLCSLTLTNCELSTLSFMFILEHCSCLHTLDLSDTHGAPVHNVDMFNPLAVHCTALTSLNLSNYRVKQVDNLQYVDIIYCVMVSLIQHCPGLLSVNLSNTAFTCDELLTELTTHCTGLTQLDLGGCFRVLDVGVTALVTACTSLTVLNVNGCGIVDCATILSITSSCTALRFLNIAHITDDDIDLLTTHCADLRSIIINNNEAVTEAGLMHIASSRCANLLDFVYTVSDLTAEDTLLTDTVIIALAQSCRKLKQFVCTAQHSSSIRDISIIRLAECCPLLEKLVLLPGSLLTDEALFALGDHCPRLTHLNISHCGLVTDDGMAELVDSCRDLSVLDLYHCQSLTDLCAAYLSTHCHKLRQLSLPCSNRITDASINSISAGCSALRVLRLGKDLYYSFAVKWLRKGRANLAVRMGAELEYDHRMSDYT